MNIQHSVYAGIRKSRRSSFCCCCFCFFVTHWREWQTMCLIRSVLRRKIISGGKKKQPLNWTVHATSNLKTTQWGEREWMLLAIWKRHSMHTRIRELQWGEWERMLLPDNGINKGNACGTAGKNFTNRTRIRTRYLSIESSVSLIARPLQLLPLGQLSLAVPTAMSSSFEKSK